ncbi:MAG: hypothetical protein QXN55_00725 [Candidatus Nitrosotenuis sp.]
MTKLLAVITVVITVLEVVTSILILCKRCIMMTSHPIAAIA